MLELLVALVLGLAVGAAIVAYLLRRRAEQDARDRLDEWRLTEVARVRREALLGARPALKQRVGEAMADVLYAFPFDHADARFIGHPVEYVVFDGYSGVKGRESDSLSGIVFVDVRTDRGGLGEEAELVRKCVEEGRVSWLTVAIASGER